MATLGLLALTIFLTAAVSIADCQFCPDNWVQFGDSCYIFIDERVPWTSAKVFCDALGTNMLEVQSQEENDFIAETIRNTTGIEAVWMGLIDLVVEGQWQFLSNREIPEYTNWAKGMPDNNNAHENGEDCVEIWPDGTWNDLWCEEPEPTLLDSRPSPVCELDLSEEVIG